MPALAFYAQPSNPLVLDETILVSYQAKKVKFDPKDDQHKDLVTRCAAAVRQKLSALQTIDIKMTAGFALGTAALLLSYILPFSIVATVAFAYGSYQLAKRQQAYLDYTYALENLSKCCIWSLSEVNDLEAHNHAITNNEAIREMIDTLAPLTSTQQLRDFIDDKIEDELVKEANQVREHVTLFDKHLDKEKADLYFKVYGYKQGGFLAIMEGMGFAIKNAFTSLANTISSKFSSRSEPEPETATAAVTAP